MPGSIAEINGFAKFAFLALLRANPLQKTIPEASRRTKPGEDALEIVLLDTLWMNNP
jgi:hypothetical protein